MKVFNLLGANNKGKSRCQVGEAVSIPGFDLPHATWMIRTVAPLLDNDGQPRSGLLKNATEVALR